MQTREPAISAFSVLIVEDESQARQFLRNLVAKQFPRSSIHLAQDGQQGLDLYRAYLPDIVITDINMPVMNGIEMAGSIRELNPDAYLIAATAKSDTDYLLEAIRIGIDRYVLKPIEIGKLFESIEYCLARLDCSRKIKAQEQFIRKLSLAVEQSTNMILIADSTGAIEYVNPTFSGVTGYPPEEVTGKNLRALMTGARPLENFEKLWSAVNRGFEWRGEFLHRKKSGEMFWAEASITTLSTEAGYANYFVAVLQDISERRQAEEQIRGLNGQLETRVSERTEELERSNRKLAEINKELESFCYSVSHDLRAPLRAMGGFSGILREDYSGVLDEAGKECLDRISSAAVNMGQLIDDLLKLSQVTRSPLSQVKVDLSELAAQSLRELAADEPQREVQTVIREGVETCGDPSLIQLALHNLLGNAWKYTGKQPRARIEFGAHTCNGETVYFVRDNGAGFDMVHVSLLFKAFHRLHAAGEFSGTGIGLATVERIVARHGGRIWAEAEVGKGATFYFTLG
jgi:PAS domain S-box-containing protein